MRHWRGGNSNIFEKKENIYGYYVNCCSAKWSCWRPVGLEAALLTF